MLSKSIEIVIDIDMDMGIYKLSVQEGNEDIYVYLPDTLKAPTGSTQELS